MSPRYANYDNSNEGDTQFTSSWVDDAKYQQLRGTGSRSNDAFNQQYASALGGADTGTVADDGDGGWKLIKQSKGEKSDARKLEYKDLAAQWQAAGYDVRVQDHNPDFEGGTAELAVRMGSPEKQPEKSKPPVQLSREAAEAKAYTKAYEDVMLPRQGDYTVLGDESVITDFGTEYDLQLKRAQRPQTEENMAITEEDDRKNFAKNFSNDYKKAVADTLQPTNRGIIM